VVAAGGQEKEPKMMEGMEVAVEPEQPNENRGWERRGATAVFGKPYTKGESTLIPVADVYFGRRGRVVRTQPVAVIEIGPKGVKVRDVRSQLPIVLAGILLGGWNVYWIAKTVRDWLRTRRA
jgi:hypothetical protein